MPALLSILWLAVALAAPSPVAAAPALTTGTVTCEVLDAGHWGYDLDAEVEQLSDCELRCDLSMSDPRVTGPASWHLGYDVHGGRGIALLDHPADGAAVFVVTGSMEVRGPDGRWSGPVEAIADAGGIIAGAFRGIGTDAYAGWAFFALWVRTDVQGAIHPVVGPG